MFRKIYTILPDSLELIEPEIQASVHIGNQPFTSKLPATESSIPGCEVLQAFGIPGLGCRYKPVQDSAIGCNPP